MDADKILSARLRAKGESAIVIISAPILLSFFALSIKKEKSVVAGGSSSTAIILSFLSNIELFIFKS